MDKQETRERLLKFIKQCCRNYYKPDLHSFKISINGGFAMVECDYGNEVTVEQYLFERMNDGNGFVMRLGGKPTDATELLMLIGADIMTIEM